MGPVLSYVCGMCNGSQNVAVDYVISALQQPWEIGGNVYPTFIFHSVLQILKQNNTQKNGNCSTVNTHVLTT